MSIYSIKEQGNKFKWANKHKFYKIIMKTVIELKLEEQIEGEWIILINN